MHPDCIDTTAHGKRQLFAVIQTFDRLFFGNKFLPDTGQFQGALVQSLQVQQEDFEAFLQWKLKRKT